MSCSDDRQWLVPHFWKKVESQLRLNMSYLKVESADADLMTGDLIRRFSHIAPELPVFKDSPVYMRFSMLMADAVTAEQHLFAARTGRVPGELMSDWQPSVPAVDHPFLRELKKAVSVLEDEARAGGRVN